MFWPISDLCFSGNQADLSNSFSTNFWSLPTPWKFWSSNAPLVLIAWAISQPCSSTRLCLPSNAESSPQPKLAMAVCDIKVCGWCFKISCCWWNQDFYIGVFQKLLSTWTIWKPTAHFVHPLSQWPPVLVDSFFGAESEIALMKMLPVKFWSRLFIGCSHRCQRGQ